MSSAAGRTVIALCGERDNLVNFFLYYEICLLPDTMLPDTLCISLTEDYVLVLQMWLQKLFGVALTILIYLKS